MSQETMGAVVKSRASAGAEWKQVPVPQVGPEDILIEVKAASICGTDLHIYQWDEWASQRIHIPQVMGHETAGEVVETGKEVTTVKVGDYVSVETHITCGTCYPCRVGRAEVCSNVKIVGVDTDGSFARYLKLPARCAWKNDRSLPPEIAALQEPLGNAVDTVMAEDVSGKTVVVLGAGPVGLLAMGVARASGASVIFATDISDYRLGLAKKMGATHTFNPKRDRVVEAVMDLTRGDGVDVVIEMSGNPDALAQGFKVLAPGGRLSLLGLSHGPVRIDLNNAVILKGARIYGITGRKIFTTWYKSSRLLTSGILDLNPLLTHRLPVTQFAAAMDLMQKGECGKIALLPAA
ncbi:MAG TPA: L-threonine 3-dehydrogenase [Candidatus Polarisedimenticolia bacterium]|jgi:threonine 3-dehydrogenase|nr:L-threonine 3-dehydrogenase [Candidatus Polarisedimenticolia bacterium]